MATDSVTALKIAHAVHGNIRSWLHNPDANLHHGGGTFTSRDLIDGLKAQTLVSPVMLDHDVELYASLANGMAEIVWEVRVTYPAMGLLAGTWSGVQTIPLPGWALTQTAQNPSPPFSGRAPFDRQQAQDQANQIAKFFPNWLAQGSNLVTLPGVPTMTARELLEGVQAGRFARHNRVQIGPSEFLLIRQLTMSTGYGYAVQVEWDEGGGNSGVAIQTAPTPPIPAPAWMAIQFSARDYEIVAMPAQSKPTSSGPPCPTCGGPTTLLFIHAVCDVCEPPTP